MKLEIITKNGTEKKIIDNLELSDECTKDIVFCKKHKYKNELCDRLCENFVVLSKDFFTKKSCYDVIRKLSCALSFMKMSDYDSENIIKEIERIVNIALFNQDCFFG